MLYVSVVTLVILIESLDEEKFESFNKLTFEHCLFYEGLFVFVSGWVKSFVIYC